MATIQARKGKGKGNGDKEEISYRVLIRLKGFPPQSATFKRKTDAKKWAEDTESAMRNGRYFKTAEAKKHTVSDLIERYKDTVLSKKTKNIQTPKNHLLWWKKRIGHYLLSDLSKSLISTCREELLSEIIAGNKNRSPSTVNRYMTTMRHAMNIALEEWEWIEINPFSKMKKLNEPRGRVRFLDDDERERLLAACKKSDNHFLYPIVVIAISTGMRQSEILDLKWKDVDFSRSQLVIHETKNDERRAVPIVNLAKELLIDMRQTRNFDSELVFPGPSPQKRLPIRKHWDKVITEAEISDFKFHDLRHTAASYFAMNGATLTEIADILGHKTLAMVKRYSHLTTQHTTSVVDDMNKKIFG